jgi:drug/metabolite transporter (DMT)-like permease
MKKYLSEGALLLNTIIWGATFALIKTALNDISPMMFISFRFTLAALLLLPIYKSVLKVLNKQLLIQGVFLGLLYFLGFASQTIGLKYTTATKSGFITGTFVVFTPIFQVFIEKRMPGKGSLIAIVLVIAGLVLLSSKGESLLDVFNEIGTNFNIGDFLTLICAIFFALYLVYLDIISKQHPYMPLVFLQIAVTAIGGILMAGIFSTTGIEEPFYVLNFNVVFAIIYTALLATVLTTILQTKYQKFVTPTKAGIIFSLEPIFAAVLAYMLLTEQISNFGFIGCILIFTGLLASELIDKNKKM